MEELVAIFGEGEDLTVLEMCYRGGVVFCLALILLRISGRRSFGIKTPLDLIISVLLGSILSRAIVGASPFIPVIVCALTIVILHRVFSLMSIYNKGFRHLAEGKKIMVFENGKFLHKNMRKALVDEEDILQKVRKQTFQDNLKNIDRIYMERNGEITVVKTTPNN